MFHRSQRLLLRPASGPRTGEAIFAGIGDEARRPQSRARALALYHRKHARAFARAAATIRRSSALPRDPCPMRGRLALSSASVERWTGEARSSNSDTGSRATSGGRAIATEAGAALIEIAATLGHRAHHRRSFLDNPASGRVLRSSASSRPDGSGERFSLRPRARKRRAGAMRLDLSEADLARRCAWRPDARRLDDPPGMLRAARLVRWRGLG